MALAYSKFDTTPANLIADLKAAIVASTDWADISVVTPTTTQTTTLAAAATTVVVASSTGMVPGMVVVLEPGVAGKEEWRTVLTVPLATSITVAALTYAHASGSVVRNGSNILKATTTRGAQMVVDLTDIHPQLNYLALGFWRTHTGALGGGVDKMPTRYVVWRSTTTGTTSAMSLHVVVSASKEHLFVSIEGPRAWEASATSTIYGSVKHYFFMADLVPYHAADLTPAVVVGAVMAATPGAGVSIQSHLCFVSRNASDTISWTPGKVASPMFVTIQSGASVSLTRQCSIDGNLYLLPYVFFDEVEGIRGRLAKIYYAGGNAPMAATDVSTPIGETLTYDGNTYKFIAVNSGDGGSSEMWGALGSAANDSSGPARSVVVALPVA